MTDQYNSAEAELETTSVDDYHPTELHAEDLDEYNKLGLPHAHPHLFAKSMLAQLARLPLMELEPEQGIFSAHTVALSA